MELIIVRHGETVANTKGLIQGQSHGRLSRNGRKQAKEIARKLRNTRIDAIFSSGLRRASDTAMEIASYHDVPVYHMRWLEGRASGRYEGMRWDDAVRIMGSDRAFRDVDFDFDGGESLTQLRGRVERFIKAVRQNHPDETVLVCTHRHCVVMMLSVLFEIPLSEALDSLEGVKDAQIVDNAEPLHVIIDGRGARYIGSNRNVTRMIRDNA